MTQTKSWYAGKLLENIEEENLEKVLKSLDRDYDSESMRALSSKFKELIYAPFDEFRQETEDMFVSDLLSITDERVKGLENTINHYVALAEECHEFAVVDKGVLYNLRELCTETVDSLADYFIRTKTYALNALAGEFSEHLGKLNDSGDRIEINSYLERVGRSYLALCSSGNGALYAEVKEFLREIGAQKEKLSFEVMDLLQYEPEKSGSAEADKKNAENFLERLADIRNRQEVHFDAEGMLKEKIEKYSGLVNLYTAQMNQEKKKKDIDKNKKDINRNTYNIGLLRHGQDALCSRVEKMEKSIEMPRRSSYFMMTKDYVNSVAPATFCYKVFGDILVSSSNWLDKLKRVKQKLSGVQNPSEQQDIQYLRHLCKGLDLAFNSGELRGIANVSVEQRREVLETIHLFEEFAGKEQYVAA